MQEGVGAGAAQLRTVIAEVVGGPLVVDRRHSWHLGRPGKLVDAWRRCGS